MTTSLIHVVIDSTDPSEFARFWSEALRWQIVIEDPAEVEIAGSSDDINLIFVPVPEPKIDKSRVHLDLVPTADEDQEAKVRRLVTLGATRADIGQGDTPWVVLADPEGNEFCVLPAGYYDDGTGPVGAMCITSEDAAVMTAFWAEATGWPRTRRGLHRGFGPHLVFGGGRPGTKTRKNRIHIDVAPPLGGDQVREANRLTGAGGRPIHIGQLDVPWIVMADPEGNEFCILTPR